MGARQQMIDVTERLVATDGLAALSLRTVQAAAGQRNKSAAQYHFGSREGLIEAVLVERMAPVNRRRAELLDALGHGRDDPAALVEVLVRPLAEATLARRPSYWARFAVQCGTDPTVQQVVRSSVEGQAYRETCARLIEALDPLPPLLRPRRVEHAVGLAFTSLASAEARAAPPTLRVEDELDDLISMCTAVATAPCSPATTARLDPTLEVL